MSSDIWQRLSGPFDPRYISWRPGSSSKDPNKPCVAMGLAYLNAREIMERLDEVVGPGNWSDRYHQAGSAIICELSIRVPKVAMEGGGARRFDGETEWITKSDGAGETDVEGSKGAISDALKRAAVKFGVGRYLYYLPKWWFPAVRAGNSCYFNDEQLGQMNNQLATWQRDYFGGHGSMDGEIPPGVRQFDKSGQDSWEGNQQPQGNTKPYTPPDNNKGVYPAKPSGNVEQAYKEFVSELAHANAARRGDGLGNLTAENICYALRELNVRVPDGYKVANWNQLKEFGADALIALNRELASRPCLIGESDIPF